MTPHVLLELLRNHLSNIPSLEGRGDYSQEQYNWLGKAKALMNEWSETKSIPFNFAVDSLIRNTNRRADCGVVVTFIYDVIARLEQSLPQNNDQAFGPGAAYDFFVALNDTIGSANDKVFIIDPYLDAEVFDGYLQGLKRGVTVRLLTSKYIDNIRVAAQKYRAQFENTVEVRKSNEIHDRIILVDDEQCWVLGASIKDAALKKPTYLAPLSADVVPCKRTLYYAVWAKAEPI